MAQLDVLIGSAEMVREYGGYVNLEKLEELRQQCKHEEQAYLRVKAESDRRHEESKRSFDDL